MLDYPATGRNRDAILTELRRILPSDGLVLEVACGSGQHAVYFSRALGLDWQPTDQSPECRASVDAWAAHTGASQVRPALALDTTAPWPVQTAGAVFCANMTHIAPWAATLGLLQGAARVLPREAPLVLYGPFLQRDVPTAPSNLAFDASLRAREPSWGIRQLETVVAEAAALGLQHTERVAMPANNLVLVFRKGG